MSAPMTKLMVLSDFDIKHMPEHPCPDRVGPRSWTGLRRRPGCLSPGEPGHGIRSSTSNKAQQDHHDRDDQENVNESTHGV
jgi:hypothetical protein